MTGADLINGTWTQVVGGGSGAEVMYDNFDNSAVVFTTPIFDNQYAWGRSDTAAILATNSQIQMMVNTATSAPAIASDFVAHNEFWTSYDFTLASQSSSNGNYIMGGGLRDTSNYYKDMYIGYGNTSGILYFRYTYTTNGPGQVSANTNVPINIGQKYRITVHWKKSDPGASNGVIEAWADNTLLYQAANVANDTLPNPSEILIGNNFRSGSSLTATLYFDNVKVGTTGSVPTASSSSNVWGTPFTAGTNEPHVVTFNTNYGYKQRAYNDINSQYDWMWESGNLYVYSSVSPETLTVEASKRDKALYIDSKSYLIFDDINFTTGNQYTVHLNGDQNNITFTNNNFQNAGLFNFVPQSSNIITDVLLENNASSHGGSGGYILTNKQHWILKGNTSYRDGIIANIYDDYTPNFPGWYPLKWSGGFMSYGTLNANNLFENNEVSYAGIRDDGYKPDPINKGFGIWLDTVTTTSGNENIVRYNKAHDNAASGLFSEKDKYSEWYGNVSYNNGEYGLRVGTDENNKPVQNNVYYNNTLYGNSINLWVVGTGGAINVITNNIFKNNLTFGATTLEFLAKVGGENDGSIGTGNIYENNSFGPESSNFIEWGSGHYLSNYADFDTAYGANTHSILGDPLFTSPSTSDFTLQSTSPAIDSGTSLGDTYKLGLSPLSTWPSSVTTLDQTVNGTGWELGAYVYPNLITPPATEEDTSIRHHTPSGHRQNIDNLLAISTTQSLEESVPSVPQASTPYSFSQNLSLGQSHSDVKSLQQFLNTHGFTVSTSGPGSPNNETTTFGSLTFQALKKYQKSVGLPSTGWFGPMTRGVIAGMR